MSLKVNIQFHISSLKNYCKNLIEEIRGLLPGILANEVLKFAIGHSIKLFAYQKSMMPCFEFIINLMQKGMGYKTVSI